MTNRTLSERLRDSARSVARASQVIADAKIKRNVAAGEPDANYSGLKPEQTVEWKAADALDEVERALQAVEEWWLREGMHHHSGAPYAIFATRAALAKLKAAVKEKEAQSR